MSGFTGSGSGVLTQPVNKKMNTTNEMMIVFNFVIFDLLLTENVYYHSILSIKV